MYEELPFESVTTNLRTAIPSYMFNLCSYLEIFRDEFLQLNQSEFGVLIVMYINYIFLLESNSGPIWEIHQIFCLNRSSFDV
jgi:hypothetical protein